MSGKSQLSESFGFISASDTLEEVAFKGRFINEVERESERGAVLTIVSFIEEQLSNTLLSFFPNKARAEAMLNPLEGVLGQLVQRANLAAALSLITDDELKAIKCLAMIRNRFAHAWDQTSFDDAGVRKAVERFPPSYFAYVDGSNRAKFNWVASHIVQGLLDRSKYAARLRQRLPPVFRRLEDLTDDERRLLVQRKDSGGGTRKTRA